MSHWTSRVLADSKDFDRWVMARSKVVTASDIPTILGLGSNSRVSVLREKLSGVRVGEDPTDLAMVAAGRHLEAGVFEWFVAETLHVEAARCGLLVTSPTHPFIGATPDGIVDDEPIEVKCVDWTSRPNWHRDTQSVKGWPSHLELPAPLVTRERVPPLNLRTAKTDAGTPKGMFRDSCRFTVSELFPLFGPPAAPLKYWAQLQVQMHVLDMDTGWIVGLQAGTTRFDLRYDRDRAFEQWMLAEVTAFYDEWQSKKVQAA